jgi:hypothetical protein
LNLLVIEIEISAGVSGTVFPSTWEAVLTGYYSLLELSSTLRTVLVLLESMSPCRQLVSVTNQSLFTYKFSEVS